MSTGTTEQSTVTTTRRKRVRRQPLAAPSNEAKALQFEGAAYNQLVERKEVKEARSRLESAQQKRDSVSRKLSSGSRAVSVDDLSRWETELAAAKAALAEIAG